MSIVEINRKLVKVDDDGASLEFVSGFSVLTPAFHQSSITSRISADNDAEVMGMSWSNYASIFLTLGLRLS